MNWKKILVICLSLLILPTTVFATNGLLDDIDRYYKAEAASGDLLDSVGANDGVATGITYQVTGKIDYGVYFDGSSADKVVVGGYPLTSQDVWSTCAWVYAEGTKKWANVWRAQDGGISVALQQTGDAGAPYSDSWRYSWYSGFTRFDAVGGTVNYDQWDLICTVNDGTDAHVWQNGVLLDSDSTVASSVSSWAYPVTLGLRPDNSAEKFEGKLDEIGMWDGELTSAQIVALYNSGNALPFADFDVTPTPTDSLVMAYYKMEESSAPYLDSTPHGRDAGSTNDPTRITGVIDYGQDFDGSNDDMTIPLSVWGWTTPNTYSFSGWIRGTDTKFSQIASGNGPGDKGTQIVINNGYLEIGGSPCTGTPYWGGQAVGSQINDGDWHHIVATFSGGNSQIGYIDGALAGSGTENYCADTAYVTQIKFGSNPGGAGSQSADYDMDEFFYYDGTLTADDALWLYSLGSPDSDQQYPFVFTPPNVDPTITNITNQVMLEDVPTTFNSLFTINDSDGNITDLTLTYASSNTSIIAAVGGVTFATSDTTGVTNVTITPEGDAYGILTITITVTDGPGGSALDSFQLTVTNVNDGPTISVINDVTRYLDVFTSAIAPFTVLDIDNPYTDLTYSASSDNAPLFTSTNFSNSDSSNQNFTMVLATYGQALVNVTVSDLEPLSDSTTFTVFAYCNTTRVPYTDVNAIDAPPTCYDVSGSFDEDTDIFSYTWFDWGNTTENNYVEVYRTSAGSWDLVASPASTNNSGSFEINLSAYPHDNFQIRGFMTDTTRTFIDGESSQRVYMDNINQQLNLPEYWQQSDGIIWSVLIITLFLTIGIASQSATLTLILSIFGLFFATNMVLNVPAQFLWTAGVIVAILIGLIAKLRID